MTTPRVEKPLLCLYNVETMEMEEIAMNEPAIKKALTCEEIFMKVEQDRRNYEIREKALFDFSSAMENARDKGHKEGREEGERLAKKTMAKRMLSSGMTLDQVSEITGLTPEELKAL